LGPRALACCNRLSREALRPLSPLKFDPPFLYVMRIWLLVGDGKPNSDPHPRRSVAKGFTVAAFVNPPFFWRFVTPFPFFRKDLFGKVGLPFFFSLFFTLKLRSPDFFYWFDRKPPWTMDFSSSRGFDFSFFHLAASGAPHFLYKLFHPLDSPRPQEDTPLDATLRLNLFWIFIVPSFSGNPILYFETLLSLCITPGPPFLSPPALPQRLSPLPPVSSLASLQPIFLYIRCVLPAEYMTSSHQLGAGASAAQPPFTAPVNRCCVQA